MVWSLEDGREGVRTKALLYCYRLCDHTRRRCNSRSHRWQRGAVLLSVGSGNEARRLSAVADTSNHRIRMLDLGSKTVTTVAGSGEAAHTDGPAVSAAVHMPRSIMFDTSSDESEPVLYVGAHKSIRRLKFYGTTAISCFLFRELLCLNLNPSLSQTACRC